jgi:peptide/nickel transport system ATP-binding protein
MTPSLLDLPPGCPFRERCERASAACAEDPPLQQRGGNRTLRCFHPYEDAMPLAVLNDALP